jgi:superoxide dismutase, Cu-Zn family
VSMRLWTRAGAILTLWLAGAPLAQAQTQPATATATLRDRSGETVATAELREMTDQVSITLTFPTSSRLTDTHAIHIHERGRCDPPDFSSAGHIFNPLGKQHGLLNPDGPMVGDLPDMVLGPTGLVRYSVAAPLATLRAGTVSLLGPGGTALVIDSGSDDNKSQPLGNAGTSIACGVILAPGQADPSAGNAAPPISPLVVGLGGLVLIALGVGLRLIRARSYDRKNVEHVSYKGGDK